MISQGQQDMGDLVSQVGMLILENLHLKEQVNAQASMNRKYAAYLKKHYGRVPGFIEFQQRYLSDAEEDAYIKGQRLEWKLLRDLERKRYARQQSGATKTPPSESEGQEVRPSNEPPEN